MGRRAAEQAGLASCLTAASMLRTVINHYFHTLGVTSKARFALLQDKRIVTGQQVLKEGVNVPVARMLC